ncbi:hypothetical protein N7493_010777 [Penicillium malachiteum]|uniref:Uncharacterized protein n=1 Tax=Penicillium malachiteum TaxID=1324776 RepID=A0AAD6HDF5_9EURO|nr:hypothetical protein N7493_010777 [Penicillium malachiteum]
MSSPCRHATDAVTEAETPNREPMVLVSQRDFSQLVRQRRHLLQMRKQSNPDLSFSRRANELLASEIVEAWSLMVPVIFNANMLLLS